MGKKNRDDQAHCYSMGPIHTAAEAQTRLEVKTTDPSSALQAKNFIPNPPSVSQTWRRHQLISKGRQSSVLHPFQKITVFFEATRQFLGLEILGKRCVCVGGGGCSLLE